MAGAMVSEQSRDDAGALTGLVVVVAVTGGCCCVQSCGPTMQAIGTSSVSVLRLQAGQPSSHMRWSRIALGMVIVIMYSRSERYQAVHNSV